MDYGIVHYLWYKIMQESKDREDEKANGVPKGKINLDKANSEFNKKLLEAIEDL